MAIVVIDSTDSVMSQWDLIRKAVDQFLRFSAKQRSADLAVIRLDSLPQDPPTTYQSSRFTDEQWQELQAYVQAKGTRGEGTNQRAALEKVLTLAKGTGWTVPQPVVVLYFSDMLVDNPADGSEVFPTWDTFDWARFRTETPNVQRLEFYYFRPRNPKGDPTERQAYKRQEELLPQLRSATEKAKLNATWISDSILKDQVDKGRFIGPQFD